MDESAQPMVTIYEIHDAVREQSEKDDRCAPDTARHMIDVSLDVNACEVVHALRLTLEVAVVENFFGEFGINHAPSF
ncbi:MAG: hypothetical protein FJX45_17355 [Alphaproteobacteria bacterium]|nr:hypothetical protein [Alphaproteobacteria bacterium]